MKNIKRRIFITTSLIVIIITLLFTGFEFYVWQKHGYQSDYEQRQKCIEVSPLLPEEEKLCEKYK